MKKENKKISLKDLRSLMNVEFKDYIEKKDTEFESFQVWRGKRLHPFAEEIKKQIKHFWEKEFEEIEKEKE